MVYHDRIKPLQPVEEKVKPQETPAAEPTEEKADKKTRKK